MKVETKTLMVQIILLTALTIVCSVLALGQNDNQFATRGTIELGGEVSYQHASTVTQGVQFTDQSHSTFSFLPYVGYFVCEGFEVGMNPIGLQMYWDSQDRVTALTLMLAPAYNWQVDSIFYPFLEGQIGYSREVFGGSLADLNASPRDGFSWGIRAGVKIGLMRASLLNVGIQYQQITLKPPGQAERSGPNLLMASIGFTFWF